jgi:hypothetical protein
MARCCEVCGKAIGTDGWEVTIEYWDGSVTHHEQCCYNPMEYFDRIKTYAIPFETPDPDAVSQIRVIRTTFYEEEE